MSKCIAFICCIFFTLKMQAQVTHALGLSVGITNAFYKSDISGVKDGYNVFLPTISADYSKHSDNLFWGGLSGGFSLRQVPIFTYENGQKTGIRVAELWMRARAGFKIERSFMTHLPYLGLGISKRVDYEYYNKNGTTYSTYINSSDTMFKVQTIDPFIEIGNKLVNSSFRDDKRNVSFSFAVRYYPLSFFKNPLYVEYDYQEFITLQYHMIEFIITASLQHNIHK